MVKQHNKPRVLMIGPGRRGRGGIDAVIWAYTKSPVWDSYACRWLETYEDSGTMAKVWVAARALLRAPFAIWRSDIIHIHTAFRASIVRKSLFLMIAKALGKKVIMHVHDYDPEYLDRVGHTSFAARVLRTADRVVALSPLWADVLRRAGVKAVEVIPNPVILPQWTAIRANSSGRFNILYVGKLENRKGYEDLLRAMPLVLQTLPSARLQFAGTGEIERAKTIADELGIGASVEFLGWIHKEDRERVYTGADVFCLPSYNEGLPMVVLEAMAFCLPVVCTPVGGLPDLIRPGDNGIFVQPGNHNEIAAALIGLLQDTVRRTAIAKSGHETVMKTYGLPAVATHLERLYGLVSDDRHEITCNPRNVGGEIHYR
jgi:glycosyltransferase involved in cell wall biosynthesis